MTDHFLPIVVGGKRIEKSAGEAYRFEYDDGTTVVLPVPPPTAAQEVVAADREPLRQISIDDLTIFFDEVRQRWTDPQNPWRQTALTLGPRVTGYADVMILSDIEFSRARW